MNIHRINDEFSFSKQLELTDIAQIHVQGFRSIICNRPDGEGSNQPTIDEIKAEAELYSLEIRYVPVVLGNITDSDIADFSSAIATLPKPTLAYCLSGKRSEMLWSMTQANYQQSVCIADVVKNARAAICNTAHRIAGRDKSSSENH